MKLKDWAVSIPDAYRPPECRGNPTVKGVLQEAHRHFKEGDCITSSAIVKIEGRKFTTQSGSVYELDGEAHPNWTATMTMMGWEIKPENPLHEYEKSFRIQEEMQKREEERQRKRAG